jgi:CBS domain-containing protein
VTAVTVDGSENKGCSMAITASNVMTQRLVTVGPDSTIVDVAAMLSQHDISAAPVCDNDGTLLGVISERDLLTPFGKEHALGRSWWLGLLVKSAGLGSALLNYLQADSRRARDLMTQPAITAPEDASPSELAELMLRHYVSRLPIVRDGKMVGLVSRGDLIAALARTPGAFANEEWQPSSIGGDQPARL